MGLRTCAKPIEGYDDALHPSCLFVGSGVVQTSGYRPDSYSSFESCGQVSVLTIDTHPPLGPQRVCWLKVRAPAKMAVADLGTHLVIVAGPSHFCVMCVEILSTIKHGVGVANVRLAKTVTLHILAYPFWCVETPLAKTPEKLWSKSALVISDGEISFDPANHSNTRMTSNDQELSRAGLAALAPVMCYAAGS